MSTPSEIVADGYDRIAGDYLAWSYESEGRAFLQSLILKQLSPGTDVLEIGCGAGLPLTKVMIAAGCRVTAIDISAQQVSAARRHVPDAELHHVDVLDFEPRSNAYDAVIASFVMGHIPAAQHASTYRKISSALRPNGLFFGSLCQSSNLGAVEDDWLGVGMYFSHPSLKESLRTIAACGLKVKVQQEISETYDRGALFTWIVAEKESQIG